MKSMILVALALVAVAVAVPIEVEKEPVKIIQSENSQDPDGSYSYNFESDDGIVRKEQGEVKEVLDKKNKPHKVVVVRGSYSYPGADGTPETVNYSADENGFKAEGSSIPKTARR